MRGSPLEAGGGGSSGMVQQVAIVMIVLILGASFYLWRMHYLRSRAGLLTITAVVLALAFLAYSSGPSVL